MGISPAHRLLWIYQTRLKLVEKDLAKPKPEVLAGINRLIARLSEMKPDDMIRHEVQDGKAYFNVATTGDLIAEIPFIPIRTPPK